METVANLPTAQPLDTPHLICHHYEAALFSRHGSAQSSQAAAQFQNQSEKRQAGSKTICRMQLEG